MGFTPLPDVHFGKIAEGQYADEDLPEYEGMDDEDDPTEATPELIELLGFDPFEEDDDEEEPAEDQADEDDDPEQLGPLPKAEVQYEHPAAGAEHCAACINFLPPHSCSMVQPPIQPEDWCNLFEADEASAADMAFDQDFPLPLDPDLLAIAQGKQYNIVQEIYAIQAARNRSRMPSNLTGDDEVPTRHTPELNEVSKRGWEGSNDFEESKVHRGADPKNPGRFSSTGGSGKKTDKPEKSESTEKAEGKTDKPEKVESTAKSEGQEPAKSQPAAKPHLIGDLAKQAKPSLDLSQDVQSLDDLYAKAKVDEPDFVKALMDVAKELGGEAVFTPPEYSEPGTTLKSRKSAQRKMADELGNDPSQLTDVLRGTVATGSVENTRAAAHRFLQQHANDIVDVRDRIIKPLGGGYRDVLIKYRTPNGLVAEVQFNSKNMIDAKLGEGHQIYEELRKLKAQNDQSHDRIISALEQRSEQVYLQAYQKDGNGNWGGHD